MCELTITATDSGKKPDYLKTAAELLKRCREFYQNPENERAFQEWKQKGSEKDEAAG